MCTLIQIMKCFKTICRNIYLWYSPFHKTLPRSRSARGHLTCTTEAIPYLLNRTNGGSQKTSTFMFPIRGVKNIQHSLKDILYNKIFLYCPPPLSSGSNKIEKKEKKSTFLYFFVR